MSLFRKESIPLEDTNAFDSLVTDYIQKSDFLKSLYGLYPSLENLTVKANERASIPFDRKLISSVLTSQYNEMPSGLIHESVRHNLDILKNENTFTITTGHQLNIFTGPLYFFYKIIDTINIAKTLREKSGISVVPVYWMVTEDHDIAEISSINLFGEKIEWKTDWKGPAGKAPCDSIVSCIDSIEQKLGNTEHAQKIIQLFRECYKPGMLLATATRLLVNALFGKYGLLIMNPDDPRLKKSFEKIFWDDLVNHTADGILKEPIKKINEKYTAQVHPRPINIFYLGNDFRERIVFEDGFYSVLNRSIKWTKEELKKELERSPEKFSPNVVLRPLYQETILPNIAYVGGPAEISYWLEYKLMFDHYKTSFPLLFLRNSALVIENSIAEKLNRFGIHGKDLFLSSDEWIKKFILETGEKNYSFQEVIIRIEKELDLLNDKITQVDSTLKSSIEAEKQRIRNSLIGIEEKVNRASKRKNETAVNQLTKLKEKLFPDNKPQERTESFIPFYTKQGENLISGLVESLDPFDFRFSVLYTNETDNNVKR